MRSKALLILLVLTVVLIGCERESNVVSRNLSFEADNFKVKRRVVFFNGITDKYLMEIIGYCSIEADNGDKQLEITCKIDNETYKKHYFGLSDNTAYFVEQINPKTVSKYRYKVNFRPTSIIPDIDIAL